MWTLFEELVFVFCRTILERREVAREQYVQVLVCKGFLDPKEARHTIIDEGHFAKKSPRWRGTRSRIFPDGPTWWRVYCGVLPTWRGEGATLSVLLASQIPSHAAVASR